MRMRLTNELAEVINEYGPKVFDDFDEVSVTICRTMNSLLKLVQKRILVPSSSIPPSAGQPDHTTVDAQGKLLVHPMVRLGIYSSPAKSLDTYVIDMD